VSGKEGGSHLLFRRGGLTEGPFVPCRFRERRVKRSLRASKGERKKWSTHTNGSGKNPLSGYSKNRKGRNSTLCEFREKEKKRHTAPAQGEEKTTVSRSVLAFLTAQKEERVDKGRGKTKPAGPSAQRARETLLSLFFKPEFYLSTKEVKDKEITKQEKEVELWQHR